MKKGKKISKRKLFGNRISKNLVYIILLLLALLLTVVVLVQSQSFSQHAQTVPSPACLGPCPSTSASISASPALSTTPCVSVSPVSQSHDQKDENVLKQFLTLLIKLLEALLGGTSGNTTANTSAPVLSPSVSPTTSISPAPCATTVSSSSSSSSTASAGNASEGCVVPPGMTALLDQDTSDSQLPWKRNGAAKVTVNFETKGVNAEFKSNMQYSATQWNKSPCLDVKLVDTCQPNTNCVTVTAPDASCSDDGNFDAVESGGFTTGGHICVKAGLGAGENKNVTVHEMGHAIGLVHRKTTHVLMNADTYPDVFNPDDTDYKNLLFDYGKQN